MKNNYKLSISIFFWPWYGRLCFRQFLYRHANMLLFIAGCLLLHFGIAEILLAQVAPANQVDFDTTEIDRATCSLYALLEGPYGALLTATAGFSALVAAVMGSYQSAYTFLTVGIGCFTARAVNSMYFGQVECDSELKETIDAFYAVGGDGEGIITGN